MLAITLSSILYTIIWLRPAVFLSFCHSLGASLKPTRIMALLAHVLKLLQFGLIAYRLWDTGFNFTTYVDKALASPTVLATRLVGFVLGCLGQFLNVSVYSALGEAGVYYGTKLGENIPWQTGWPYSHIRDPQYVGSICSVAALYLLELCTPLVAGGWTLNYCYLMLLESGDCCGLAEPLPSKGSSRRKGK